MIEHSLFDILTNPFPQPSKRDAILAAACLVFTEHSFEGASMELVARRAGVARRTLYNQFPEGKASLFHAVMLRMWQSFPAMTIAEDETVLSKPEEGLRQIGHAIADFWRPPLSIAFLRMVIGESSRFPGLMKSFYEVKAPAVMAVKNYIQQLGLQGSLNISNPELAVRQFLGLIDETLIWMRVMGNEATLPQEQIDDVIEQAIIIFVGHYKK